MSKHRGQNAVRSNGRSPGGTPPKDASLYECSYKKYPRAKPNLVCSNNEKENFWCCCGAVACCRGAVTARRQAKNILSHNTWVCRKVHPRLLAVHKTCMFDSYSVFRSQRETSEKLTSMQVKLRIEVQKRGPCDFCRQRSSCSLEYVRVPQSPAPNTPCPQNLHVRLL